MNKIKEARIAAGLTQKEVCARLNIPPRTLQDWEAGRRNPPVWVEALVLEKIEGEKKMKEKYQVSVEYPFDNADGWDVETKEQALDLFEKLKKQVREKDVAAMVKIKDIQQQHKILKFYVNRRQMFSVDELNDYENTLIAWED